MDVQEGFAGHWDNTSWAGLDTYTQESGNDDIAS
jgi:hypothetical protein